MHRRPLATFTGLVALVLAALTSGCGGPAHKALTAITTTTGATGVGTTSTAPSPTAPATTPTAKTTRAATTTAATTTAATTTAATTTAATATKATTTAATTAKAAPTTGAKTAPTTGAAAWRPPVPAPTASQAAYGLVEAWAGHDRKAALADASPGAVTALFANPYPSGGPQYRGCSTPPGDAPSSCVFRSGNDLLSLTTVSFPGGWGVTAALMES